VTFFFLVRDHRFFAFSLYKHLTNLDYVFIFRILASGVEAPTGPPRMA
jgi:hypothetical protein